MNAPLYCALQQCHSVHVSGEDAGSFLHNLLTCDVNALPLQSSTYGGLCTPKGRLLATFLMWRTNHGYALQLPAALRETVQMRLSKYILRSRVRISDATSSEARFGVAGTGSDALLRNLFGASPPAAHAVLHLPDAILLGQAADRYEIVVPAARADACEHALRTAAAAMDPSYWDWLDIRAGIPVILPATQEEFVPQMVNLDCIGGVSFTKGCYPGQEIVARMHYLGRLKQRMYLAHIAGDAEPRPGDRLYSTEFGDQATGMIVSAAPAPAGGYDMLAVVHIGSAASGDVRWKGPDQHQLEFQPMPYAL